MTYFINLIFVPIYYFIISQLVINKRKRNQIFMTVVAFHAISFRACANPFNYVDTEGYAQAFEYISSGSFQDAFSSIYTSWGIGYVALNWILSKVSTNPMLLFTILSIVTVGGVLNFYKRTSHACLVTVLFFFIHPMLYHHGFGVVRQHFAIVFLLFALLNIHKTKQSLILAILAFLMHPSCIIFFPFYFWRLIPFERKGVVLFTLFSIIGFVAMRVIMPIVLSYLPRYMDSGFGNNSDASSNIVPIILLGSLVLAMYISGANKKLLTLQEKNLFSFILYGFVVALFGFGLQGAGRLTLPFIYIIPVVMTYVQTYSKQKVYYYCYVFFVFAIMIYMLSASYDPIDYDYISVFENVKEYK